MKLTVPSFLFVCYGNACRSVMAAGITTKLAAELGKLVLVRSAGVHPALPNIEMDEETISVMLGIGVDVSGHNPRHVRFATGHYDVLVNLSQYANEDLFRQHPHLKADKWQRWEVEDPRGKSLELYEGTFLQLVQLVNEHILPKIQSARSTSQD